MPAAPCTRCGGPRGYVALSVQSPECEACAFEAGDLVMEPPVRPVLSERVMRSIERATGGM
jgi:hypothetical protein